ncbi:hypothetical protein HN51_044238 [Arachis hypogaea]
MGGGVVIAALAATSLLLEIGGIQSQIVRNNVVVLGATKSQNLSIITVYVDFWEMEPPDSDLFGTHSDKEFPRGDELEFLDDDSEVDEDRPQDKRIAELSREDILQLEFSNEDAVYRFYKTYAMLHGFAVRLDEVRRDS